MGGSTVETPVGGIGTYLRHGRQVSRGRRLWLRWVGTLDGFPAHTWAGPDVQLLRPHTLVRAEAPLAVIVVAGGGRTPQLPIAAAGAGAALVLVAQEGEGEDTWGAFRVPAHSGHGCGIRDMGQREAGGPRPPPGATAGHGH